MALFDFLKSKSAKNGRILAEIPVARIVPSAIRPRRSIDDESIEELARSIAQVGLIQPLVVRKSGRGFELIAGERRLLAMKRLGLKRAACIVDRRTEGESLAVMALAENLQREELNYFEAAKCCGALLRELCMTQEELAERIGKSPSFVENKLSLLRLEPRVRDALMRQGLGESYACAALRLNGAEARLALVKRAGDCVTGGNGGAEGHGGEAGCRTDELMRGRSGEPIIGRRTAAKPRSVVVRLVRDHRIFLNTINLACEQLRSGGVKVELSTIDNDEGMDISIHIERERVGNAGGREPAGERRALAGNA